MPNLKRREFLGVLGAGAAAATWGTRPRAAGAAEGGDTPAPRRPNVLFLLSDDQRYDTIACMGNPIIKTPNLDALVAAGTVFTNPYIQGGTGGAICVCTRSMVMTGRTIWHSPDNMGTAFPLWPEVMQRAGYHTHGIGKWHNGAPSYARCFMSGGPIFFGGMTNQSKVPVHDFDPSGKYPKSAERTAEQPSSELFSDAAVQFLRGYKEEKPFFLYVAYTSPHDPRTAPEPFASMYDPGKIPLPLNFMPEHPFDNGELKGRDEKLAPWPRTPEVVRRHIADYYAMISHLDREVGRVLAALDETGRAKDTIVIFAGDNGLALGQHGLFGKQSVYEHSVRVPLIMRGPGVPAGQKRDAFVYLLDLYPTVCGMAGVAVPDTVEGKSLVPVLADPKPRVRETVFAAYRDLQRMVRDERWKLIRYSVKGEKRTQLFDLAADPWETKDLSADPACAATLESMGAKLRAWQEQTGDKRVL